MVTKSDVAKAGINVTATAAKYGVKAGIFGVRMCGRIATGTLGMTGKMANMFANDGLGTPVADMFGKTLNKGLDKAGKKIDQVSSSLINKAAANLKNRV